MKNEKLLAGLLILTSVSLFSCKKEDSFSSTYTMSFPATLVQNDGKYTAYVDKEGIIYLTEESVQNANQESYPLSETKRATLLVSYDYQDYVYEDKTPIVKKAELITYAPIPTSKVYVAEPTSEEDKKVVEDALNPDSIHQINSVYDEYAYLGYFNLDFTAMCNNSVEPKVTLLCDSVKNNEMYVRLLFNNHSVSDPKKELNRYFYSFEMSSIQVPGYDSITVNLGVYNNNTKPVYSQKKIGRGDVSGIIERL